MTIEFHVDFIACNFGVLTLHTGRIFANTVIMDGRKQHLGIKSWTEWLLFVHNREQILIFHLNMWLSFFACSRWESFRNSLVYGECLLGANTPNSALKNHYELSRRPQGWNERATTRIDFRQIVGQTYANAGATAAFGNHGHQLIANNQLFSNHSLTLP